MTPETFCYWLKGIAASEMAVGDMGALVLREAATVLDHVVAHRGPAKIPSMRQVKVTGFCMHNVFVTELCAACRAATGSEMLRMFGLKLPVGTACVYIGGQDASRTDQEPVVELNSSAGAGAAQESVEPAGEARPPGALGFGLPE